MDIQAIRELADALVLALEVEHVTKCAVESARANAEIQSAAVIGAATVAGEIDGKNADTRKAQKAAILAESSGYRAALREIADTENEVALAEIKRRQVEAVVGLTKAWLYSQSGH